MKDDAKIFSLSQQNDEMAINQDEKATDISGFKKTGCNISYLRTS